MAKKILVVDDNADFVKGVETILRAHQYEVCSASNGTEGLKQIAAQKPDLVILDVMMDEITEGFDVARKLQKSPELKSTPVILLTGIRKELHLPFGFERDDELLPVATVLEKPIAPEALLKKIEELLQK